jgi:putative phosphoribosyl transferase
VPTVQIPVPSQGIRLNGELTTTAPVQGVALIAAGRSGRPERDTTVARHLHTVGWATLLLDLLAPGKHDSEAPAPPASTDALTHRLVDAIDWLTTAPASSGLPISLIGAAADSSPVLSAAAARSDPVESVVLLSGHVVGGVPVEWVRAPVLLVCLANDQAARAACAHIAGRLRAPHRIHEISGTDRLFATPQAADEAARVVAAWLQHPDATMHGTA